ncbi:unnamed protein product [Ectocarpus sp. CCAP 1310/34]|nr:unnamed protein product [Ectocarpus sp. CCAP 1310/34]
MVFMSVVEQSFPYAAGAEAVAAERPAAQSESMPSEGGDTRLDRPAGSESSPRPEDQPRSPADVSLIDTLARALQRVKIEPEDEYREVPTPKEAIRISAGITIPAFTGKFSPEDDVQTAVMVFTSQFRSLLEQECCLGAIESKNTIRVGKTDADISALKVEHGTVAGDRAVKAWQLIISKIQVPTIVPAILASGCPTESWDQFLNFYRVHAETDKLELQGQWYSLKQQVGEEPRRYLTRTSVLRQKLEAYGWVQSDHDANARYVRNLLPDFNVQRSVLLAHSEVKTELVEKVILTAWAETEAARKRASESVGAYALVTGGDNRGGGGGNMGDRGKMRGQRRTAARQQQQQPQQPQQQHQPYFKQQQQGNEPPIHPNDPRKRCENCGELGHNHLFCPPRVDVGRPAGMPAVNAPPWPPPPRPPAGGYSQRPPWANSYGQTNTV